MKANYKKIGDYIQELKVRNTEEKAEKLLGININKFFMPSVANVVGTDLSVYKLVRKNQFACNRMHVGRDYRLPISMSKVEEEFMVSPAYDVFEIKDTEVLNPEYLMMWFSRSEFDRNAWFFTDADVRGGLPWKSFCDMQLPIPHPDKQKEIVKDYNTIVNRIALNNQLIKKLEETAQAIYKQWFVDFEFPNENGKPYKSNGGEMVESELGEIPKGWEVSKVGDLCDVKGGKRLPKGTSLNQNYFGRPYIKIADMTTNKFLVLNDKFEYVDDDLQKEISRYIVAKNDVLISIVGTIGLVNIVHTSLDKANQTENCMKMTNFKSINSDFLYHYLTSTVGQQIIESKTVGGVQGKLPMYNIQSIPIVCPANNVIKKYKLIAEGTNEMQQLKTTENTKLLLMKDLLLSKLATIEN